MSSVPPPTYTDPLIEALMRLSKGRPSTGLQSGGPATNGSDAMQAVMAEGQGRPKTLFEKLLEMILGGTDIQIHGSSGIPPQSPSPTSLQGGGAQ